MTGRDTPASREKLCVFCTHLRMDTSGCHGDYPDPVTFECRKDHWQFVEFDRLREAILRAETCKDYKQA